MENRVTNAEIKSWIDDLVGAIGFKEHAPRDEFLTQLRRGATKDCIEGIARYLGLPIKVDLTFVTSSSRSGFERRSDGFQSTTLVNTDSHGHGSEGITAQVGIPSWLPPYGSPSLTDYRIRVKVSEDCRDYPDSFIAVMAHELCHIVLASLSHPEKDNEFFTDLTAMVLGFSLITKQGRRVSETWTFKNERTTTTTTYGYLSDRQFEFAHDQIVGLLNGQLNRKKELLRRLNAVKEDLALSRKKLADFGVCLGYLDSHTTRRISAKDGLRIVRFHQAGYTDEHMRIFRCTDEIVSQSEQATLEIIHHTKYTSALMQKRAEELLRIQGDLAATSKLLTEDLRTLERNLPLHYRLKRFLNWDRATPSPSAIA